MAKKGGQKHLKRKKAPKIWPIHRKEFFWTVRPEPGPHPLSRCIPLTVTILDILGFAKTRKEAKRIISHGKIKVDGKVRKEESFPIGFMDVISIPEAEKAYRTLPSEKGLAFHPIGKDETEFKLCRIETKTVIQGGKTQLNLHDGRNMLIEPNDPRTQVKIYQTLDTLEISVLNQEVIGHIKLAVGSQAIITGGKNTGRYGKIVAIERIPNQKRKKSLVTIEEKSGKRFQTILDYVFAIGDKKPNISLPGG